MNDALEAVQERATFTVDGEHIELADQALDALGLEARADTFVRARMLVRVVRDSKPPRGVNRATGLPFIDPLPPAALRDRLARLGDWIQVTSRSERAIMPPDWIVQNIMARASWPLHPLEAVMETPTMRPDGTILHERGYDCSTGILMQPSQSFPGIPDEPSQEDVSRCGQHLLEPFRDFPFRETCDRAAAVAAVLSILARPAIEGPVPMFAFRAPTPGTGKSLLADVISTIGTGRTPSHATVPEKADELRKIILTVAMQGLPTILIDNVVGRFGNGVLSAALTSDSWQDRVLGVNKIVEAPLTAVWLVTGNNINFKGDLGRRIVVSDQDAGIEHPEDRAETTFAHYPLLPWVNEQRPALVSSGLTLLRAYHVAGRPKHGAPQKGSFESWDNLIRGCLIWTGIGDPDEGKERIRLEDDSDISTLGDLLENLSRTTAGIAFTVNSACEIAKSDSDLETAINNACSSPKPEPRRLGYVLRNSKGRIVNGLRVDVFRSTGGKSANQWVVKDVGRLL